MALNAQTMSGRSKWNLMLWIENNQTTTHQLSELSCLISAPEVLKSCISPYSNKSSTLYKALNNQGAQHTPTWNFRSTNANLLTPPTTTTTTSLSGHRSQSAWARPSLHAHYCSTLARKVQTIHPSQVLEILRCRIKTHCIFSHRGPLR